MTSPKYARLTATLLAMPEETPRVTDESRVKAISAMEVALRQRRGRAKRERALKAGIAAFAAAAAVALGVRAASFRHSPVAIAPAPASLTVVAHASGDGIRIVGAHGEENLVDGTHVGAGTRLLSGNSGRVALSLSTGTLLSLDNGSDFTLLNVGPTEAFRVDSGSIRADVAKLAANERFLLETPDLEVEVHGTSFRVTVLPPEQRCADGSRSRVTVYEGVVAVRKQGVEKLLHAGDEFNGSCGATTPTVAPAEVKPPVITAPPRAVEPRVSAAATPAPHSSLEAQNNLFAEGVAQKRAGALSAAVSSFDRLLARYPDGPLTESASAERMRILRGTNPTLASAAARQYLERFPSGFAAADAKSILASRP